MQLKTGKCKMIYLLLVVFVIYNDSIEIAMVYN